MSPAAERPTGTVTFLFTDIEGSTRLLKELRHDYATALADHQRIVRSALAANDGWEIDTQGDSFFAAFRRAKDAVGAAVDAQHALAAHGWPQGALLRVRMGMHTGEPAVGGERYVGLGVHRAARIAAAGHGGQVLVSQTTRGLLRDDPPPDVTLRDLGEHELKDMDEPERIYQLVAPGLDEDFAPLKTTAPALAAGREGELVEAAEETVGEMAAPWRRRRVLLGAGLVVAVLLGIALTIAFTRGSATASTTISANSVGVLDSKSAKIEAKVSVGDAPSAIASGAGAVWVANTQENSVSRIDPKTQDVRQTITVGQAPAGIAAGGGAVWVTNGLDGSLSRISPETNTVVQSTPVGNGPVGVTYGGGFVWVVNSVDGTIAKVDPVSGDVVRTVAVANGIADIAYGADRLWVTSAPSGLVLAVDPASGTVLDRIAVVDPSAVAVGAGAVWVTSRSDGTVARIDPRARAVTDSIPVGRNPVAVAADPKSVWVANARSGTISQIEPRSVRVAKTVRVDNAPSDVAVTPQGAYVAVRATGAAHRGGTLRLLAWIPVDFLDPALSYTTTGWSILSSTNDGLVGFRRTGGIGGVTLVPDLAASLPAPADGGKTWTFRLRRDVRYSNGKPVQPQDFRRGIERLFEIAEPHSPGTPYFGRLVGAAQCRPRRCDLSRGIVTDPVSRTITFHLTAPDAEFPTKLALTFADAVPASTPARSSRIPATGPYMIASANAKVVRLVRNRYFREWSSDAQPDGYPDRIEIRTVKNIDPAIRAVTGGSADGVLAVGGLASKQQLEDLARRYPSQVRATTSAITGFFFMNTREPPFDDVRVRRAANYAFDRQAFAHLVGRGVAPTCQILPPNTPSFRRTCPYQPGGAAGLDKARRLVRESGTAGQKVVVLAPKRVAFQARYMARVLESLGYKATVHVVEDGGPYFTRISDSRRHVQIGFNAWQADFPSESGFLGALLKCSDFVLGVPDQTSNSSFYCDRSVDRQMDRAVAVALVNPPAAHAIWQAAERKVLAAAPIVPTYNWKNNDFVSKRLGNYQYHPQWGPLIDQFWVR